MDLPELPITSLYKSSLISTWDNTLVMGVINITPDSFSDGGVYLDKGKAIKRAGELLKQGAYVLDLGAQSTRPGSEEVGADEELRRLLPALKGIRTAYPQSIISVDTFHSKVAESALNHGANWINDVSGGMRDNDLLKVVAEAGCPYVLMHSRGNGRTMDNLCSYDDVVIEVRDGLLRRTEEALKAGLITEQIIWDPGLGFAKSNVQNLQLIKGLDTLNCTKFPLLIGPSRKRFVGEILNEPVIDNRIWGTLAIACLCCQLKVFMIRSHEVIEVIQTLKMAKRIWHE